jgi:hypothetical protein
MPSLTVGNTRSRRFTNVLRYKARLDQVPVTARVVYEVTFPRVPEIKVPSSDLLAAATFVVGSKGWVELELQTKVDGEPVDLEGLIERVLATLSSVSQT